MKIVKERIILNKLKKWLKEETKRHEIGEVVKTMSTRCFDDLYDKDIGLGTIAQIIRLTSDTVYKKIEEIDK